MKSASRQVGVKRPTRLCTPHDMEAWIREVDISGRRNMPAGLDGTHGIEAAFYGRLRNRRRRHAQGAVGSAVRRQVASAAFRATLVAACHRARLGQRYRNRRPIWSKICVQQRTLGSFLVANRHLMKFLLTLISLVVAQAQSAESENRSTSDYTVVANVQYCTAAGKPLLMDVFVPRQRIRPLTPAVLWLHGGGWERGDKNGSSGARFLASAGFVAASIYYRLSGEATFPADIEDCKCAIRYLRANAWAYGIDPSRIGVAGASSGGHLAMLVGTADEKAGLEGSGGWPMVSSRVKAVVSYYGPSDFRTMNADFGARAQSAITKLLGVPFQEKADAYARASPITYISPDDPPLLMVHGDGDTLVPFTQSDRMRKAYTRAGLRARLVKVKNANHDFEPVIANKPLSISIEAIHRMTVDFLRGNL